MNKKARLDQGTYEASKKYLKSALEHMVAAGRNARDLTEFVLDKFGDDFRPYLHQFLSDVRQGEIDIKGLTHAARTAVVGHHVSQEEREKMIREAAYLRSEQRGFAGGYEHDDWLSAEKDVDAQLEREAGLVVKGGKAMASVVSIAEKEFDSIKKIVSLWLDENLGSSRKAVKKAPVKKKAATASKKTSKADTGSPVKAEPKKKQKTATVKQAAKKKAVTKKQTKSKKPAE